MFRRNLASIQSDARHLPLPDASVDLIVTSPPYFSLRDYQEDGESLKGQVGNEPTPEAFLKSLLDCTAEWMRVLKPRGSIFVNLGDKWAGGGGGPAGRNPMNTADPFPVGRGTTVNNGATWGFRPKSLMGLPWRYAIGCIDQLGLILREEIIWAKPNGLPESVRDRCRRAHEQVFHFTKQGDYYSAIARIREDQLSMGQRHKGKSGYKGAPAGVERGFDERELNPLGKLPSSVWEIPLFPLNVPKWLAEDNLLGEDFDYDHFAAYPPELVQRIILGYSPKDVCTRCGQGRFPVTVSELAVDHVQENTYRQGKADGTPRWDVPEGEPRVVGTREHLIVGNACACTPYEDHPENRGKDWRGTDSGDRHTTGQRMGKDFQGNGEWTDGGRYRAEGTITGGNWGSASDYVKNQYGRAPVREYHMDQWDPAPTVPGVVLDPFGGTGTTAIVAAIMDRHGITCDLSHDYAKHLVDWRSNDRSQMKALLGSKS